MMTSSNLNLTFQIMSDNTQIKDQFKAKFPQKSTWREEAQKRAKQPFDKYATKIAIRILRELRAQKMSQKQLAEILEVSPQQVNKWVKGKSSFQTDTIVRIEDALGINIISINTNESHSECRAEDNCQIISISRSQNVTTRKNSALKQIIFEKMKVSDF